MTNEQRVERLSTLQTALLDGRIDRESYESMKADLVTCSPASRPVAGDGESRQEASSAAGTRQRAELRIISAICGAFFWAVLYPSLLAGFLPFLERHRLPWAILLGILGGSAGWHPEVPLCRAFIIGPMGLLLAGMVAYLTGWHILVYPLVPVGVFLAAQAGYRMSVTEYLDIYQ